MDEIDRKLLTLIQEDSTRSISDIAERVGLTNTPCWRRLQNLEDQGVIRKRVALLNPDKMNLSTTAFVAVKTNQHSQAWLDGFARAVKDIPEVMEFYRMSGETDYLMRIVVPDIAGYDIVYKRLIEKVDLADVTSSFAMEQIKYTTALPVSYVK